jgi:hypothetical protein
MVTLHIDADGCVSVLVVALSPQMGKLNRGQIAASHVARDILFLFCS